MRRPVIKRYFSEDIFAIIKPHFRFWVKKDIGLGLEYDLQLRDKNCLNVYYKGNSLGKIQYIRRKGLYAVSVHDKFISEGIRTAFKPQNGKSSRYLRFSLRPEQLEDFYTKPNLSSMAQKVKKVNFKEELTFEQMLIADNVNRPDFIIIDRQIADHLDGNQMDLLALIRKKSNQYQFCVIEVKLGNNPDLKGKVARQLGNYVNKIKTEGNFKDYKKCYEQNFQQKRKLGLFDGQPQIKNIKNIDIVDGVFGMVVVVGYLGIAQESIRELKQQYPDIRVLLLKNIIDFSKTV